MTRFRLVVALLLLLAACSVPVSEDAQLIEQDDLPETLQRSSTTTTTSLPPASGTLVDFYLLTNPPESEQRKVVKVTREVPPAGGVIKALIGDMFSDDFVASTGEDLVNTLPAFTLDAVNQADGSTLATVVLSTVDPDTPPSTNALDSATAQLVYTLTQFPKIDSIQVEVNGNESDPVTVEDYRRYDPDFEATTTTTTGG
ncbi:MAG: GerMN domain-containing protein [Acidimicrobiales bacterium]